MDAYTITITPVDDSGNSTTLTVDISTGRARITSVHMEAPAGLTGAQGPSVDVGLLLQAVTGPTPTPAAITATSTPTPAAAPEPTPAPVAVPVPADAGVDGQPATTATTTPRSATGDTTPPAPATAPARRTSRRPAARVRSAENEATPSTAARRGRKQPTPTKAAPKKPTRKQTPPIASAAADSDAGRVYRRMPDDFAAMYRQAGTAAAIAEHYGVPRYTAQGWIGRYKKQNPAANN